MTWKHRAQHQANNLCRSTGPLGLALITVRIPPVCSPLLMAM